MSYYIYAYLRSDSSPYYIGKGTGRRAYNETCRTVLPPKDKSKIVIMENNLTEVGALALERFYIRWYGRKDNGTGILRNRTDGGDGIAGYVYTEEHRRKTSETSKARKHTAETKRKISESRMGEKHPFYGKKLSEETRKKMSQSHLGKEKKKGQIPWNKGKSMSEESKRKISETKRLKK